MTHESGAVRRFLSSFVFAIDEPAVSNQATPAPHFHTVNLYSNIP
jgi:hypothetical protein